MGPGSDLIRSIQGALKDLDLPGWLFFGFRNTDPIALRILGCDPKRLATRRWFYLVPAEGAPRKLLHRIEPDLLQHLPGRQSTYLRWEELQAQMKDLLAGMREVAMQYSPNGSLPDLSLVDGGTLELVRSSGSEVVSSAELIQRFEAVWTADQMRQHREAAEALSRIVQAVFREIADGLGTGRRISEMTVQDLILEQLHRSALRTEHPPIVAVNQNSADPHYQPTSHSHSRIGSGDFLLIDLWGKLDQEGAVYADITWTAQIGTPVPGRVRRVFETVCEARDQGILFLEEAFRKGIHPQGWEVDEAVRQAITRAGYGSQFLHRTGHSLGQELHGNGAHFDNFETRDTRQVIPGLGCTIEPGIYLPGEFGIRSEINVLITPQGPEVTTAKQQEIVHIPA